MHQPLESPGILFAKWGEIVKSYEIQVIVVWYHEGVLQTNGLHSTWNWSR